MIVLIYGRLVGVKVYFLGMGVIMGGGVGGVWIKFYSWRLGGRVLIFRLGLVSVWG